MFLLIFEGILIGILLGLTGAGGGILAIPALMYSQNWTIAEAAPVGLLAITLSSGIGAFDGLYRGVVRYKAAIWIALFSIPTVYTGIYLRHMLPVNLLTFIFCFIMASAALRSLFTHTSNQTSNLCPLDPETGRFSWTIQTQVYLGGIGLCSGLMTGVLGVGGGFLIIPALKKVSKLSFESISSTSLMIIFLIGLITCLTQLSSGYHYPKEVTSTFIISCVLGLFIGKYIQRYISELLVKRFFSVMLIIISLSMALRTLS
ncbi:sulfite exporter TauE/SafE family protein [Acinetobacter apis]|uniref:Probable membrane transporter protein n=1 Tax=Acinetobacter apis TaxID=1229165 RepID=A0A217EDP3_9GAMM|nr:sulfite exporter TauE/SafE family protein [Acinetobacter apis]SNQ28623.1 hypothetical protein SAMN05444584_0547 [Acinetobacter apis]